MIEIVSPAVLVGAVKALTPDGRGSAIDKSLAPAPWTIERNGIVGDAQADRKYHGGPEKAVHHYAFEHHDDWIAELGPHRLFGQKGAFGENFSTIGWNESNVHIGDIVRFGPVLLQVSQGRQPCWKLNARFDRTDMARLVQKTGRTGWYYRVIETGRVDMSAQLELVERTQPDWPLARITRLLYRDTDRYAELADMSRIEELSESWRRLAGRRVQSRTVESWASRLDGALKT